MGAIQSCMTRSRAGLLPVRDGYLGFGRKCRIAAWTVRMIDIHSHYLSPNCFKSLNGGRGALSRSVVASLSQDRFTDLDSRAAWMKSNGIETQILAPEMTLLVGLSPDEEIRSVSSINDAVAKDIRDRAEFRTLALLPLSSGAVAAAELNRRMGDPVFCGGMIHTRALDGLAASHLDILWARATELQAPLVLHSMATKEDERALGHQLASPVGRPHDVARGALELVFGGVLDRFPDLEVILTLGGGSLVLVTARLDADYELRANDRSTAAAPSTYLSRFYFDTLVFGEDQLRFLIQSVGYRRMMLGTDYPLPLCQNDPGHFLRRSQVVGEEFDAIASGNADQVFMGRSTTRVAGGV